MLDHVIWAVPSRVMSTQFSGALSLADIEKSHHLSYELMETDEGKEGVFAIVDITRCETFSNDLMNMSVLRGVATIHPRTLWLVAIEGNTNPVFRFLALSVIKILRLKYTIVRAHSDAIDFIRRIDPSINPF